LSEPRLNPLNFQNFDFKGFTHDSVSRLADTLTPYVRSRLKDPYPEKDLHHLVLKVNRFEVESYRLPAPPQETTQVLLMELVVFRKEGEKGPVERLGMCEIKISTQQYRLLEILFCHQPQSPTEAFETVRSLYLKFPFPDILFFWQMFRDFWPMLEVAQGNEEFLRFREILSEQALILPPSQMPSLDTLFDFRLLTQENLARRWMSHR